MKPQYDVLIGEQVEAQKHRYQVNDHPCFNSEAHGRKGRLHLPVSPSCNIQCRFCHRDCNYDEERPGVAGGILRPEEAVDIVEKALNLCPEITVVGIAGPGDTLASPNAIQAFELVHQEYPHLIKCLSTNGLLLPGMADQLYDVGVRTVTVTVNAVDPMIASQVVSHIVYQGKIYRGEEAGRILIKNQLQGIQEVSEKGMLVKVNTVLIPTINDKNITDIAFEVSSAGATIHNIIPLIPQHDLAHIPAPTCEEINWARQRAGVFMNQFLHCRHCRADACGIIGQKDLSDQLYGGRRMETFSHG